MLKRTIAASVALLVWMQPGLSEAVYSITTCSTASASPNTNAKLMNDIVCDPSNGDIGITLNAGADLDMNGKTIYCASAQLCSAAVTFAANNSIVQGGGTVSGAFSKVVDCAGKGGSRVSELKFVGYSAHGMANCATVEENVMVGDSYNSQPPGAAVYYSTLAPTSVSNNYVAGFGNAVYFTSAISAGVIDHNVLIGGDHLIYFAGSTTATMTNNILMSSESATSTAIFPVGSDSGVYVDNLCNSSAYACYLCIVTGRCNDNPSTPFAF